MITKNTLELFSKPEKLIARPEDLKVGYLYLIRDRKYAYIMLITNLEDVKIRGDLLEVSDEQFTKKTFENFFNMNKGVLSLVPENHVDFVEYRYAFYEIGPKENHLEYFL
jgi:hypothetical protein